MRNIIRIIVRVGLVGVGGRYWYQNPTRYQDTIDTMKHKFGTSLTGSTQSGNTIISGSEDQSIIDQLNQQLSGITNTSGGNPYGEIMIDVAPHTGSNNSQTGGIQQIIDTSVCIAPWGKQIAGGEYTLAFKYTQAQNNVCVIEKRICSHGLLGGSYQEHTCYFTQNGGYYEYLGLTGTDYTQLIITAEQQWLVTVSGGNGTSQGQQYVDDTINVPNYGLIDGPYIPQGSKGSQSPSGSSSNNTQGGTLDAKYTNLGPIVPRVPEVRHSNSIEQKINPNSNGIQGIISTQANSPTFSYTSDTASVQGGSPAFGTYSCRSPWGTQVFHNQHIIAFESSTVSEGSLCQSELRTCTFGYLRGSYTNQTCTIQPSYTTSDRIGRVGSTYESRTYSYYDYYPQSCNVPNYGLIGHNSIVLLYRATNPQGSCEGQTRRCVNGVLQGSDQYRYSWCVAP